MTFILDSINWDVMKYVLQKRPLGSLPFSTSPLNSGAPPARLLRSLRSLAPFPLPSSCARGPPVPSLDRPILLNVSPERHAVKRPLQPVASRLTGLLVGALRASQPLVCLTRFAGHHSGSSEAFRSGGLGPPPLSLRSSLGPPSTPACPPFPPLLSLSLQFD